MSNGFYMSLTHPWNFLELSRFVDSSVATVGARMPDT